MIHLGFKLFGLRSLPPVPSQQLLRQYVSLGFASLGRYKIAISREDDLQLVEVLRYGNSHDGHLDK